MKILDSLREMCAAAHEASGQPAEVEVRLPLEVVRAIIRETENDPGRTVRTNADDLDPWLRSFEAWGAIYVHPLPKRRLEERT